MSTPNQIINGGHFQDFEGNPLALGYLLFQLSHDEQASSDLQVVAGLKLRVNLDSSGNINPSVGIWSSDALTPAGSFYIVRAFKADGTEAWANPQYFSIPSSPNPLDFGTLVPLNPPGSGLSGGGSTLLLQTNGVTNGSQTKLNLHSSDSSVTLTDDGSGNVNFQVAGSGGVATTNFRIWRPNSSGSLASGQDLGVGAQLTSNAASVALVTATATEPIMYSFHNQGPNDGGCYVLADGNTGGGHTYPTSYGVAKLLKVRFQNPIVQSTSVWRNWIGWSDGFNSNLGDNPTTTNTVSFRYVLSIDGTTWHAYCSNGASSTVANTGITVDNSPHTFQIATTGSSAVFSIDGTSVATITTTLPATSVQIWPIVQEEWQMGGQNFNMYIGGIYYEYLGGW